MPLNYDHLMGLKRAGDRFSYTDRETMLYAIAIGMGGDPLTGTNCHTCTRNPTSNPR